MSVIITDLTTKEELYLVMLPEQIKFDSNTSFQSHGIIGFGEIKLPAGEELTKVSWSGKLPGKNRISQLMLNNWGNK